MTTNENAIKDAERVAEIRREDAESRAVDAWRPTFCAQEYANQATPKDRFILVACERHGYQRGRSDEEAKAMHALVMAAKDLWSAEKRIRELESKLAAKGKWPGAKKARKVSRPR